MPLLAPPPRSLEPELIDAEGQDAEELAHSLGQVARVDRLLGAEGAVRARLSAAGLDHGVGTVLDLGAGNGEVLERLGEWLTDRGPAPPRLIALDPHPDALRVGRTARAGLGWIRGDGRRLPLADRSIDLVISVLTLHHLERDGAITLLREAARVARRGVIVSDLERSRLHWIGARLLAATLWRSNRLTRADAPASVLRGWTRAEMAELFSAAGLEGAEVRRHLPFRLVGVWVR